MTVSRSRVPRLAGTVAVLALVAIGAVAFAAPPSGAVTSVAVPDSIDHTGATDVTDALDAFLARVPPGATVELATNGRYKVDGTLLLANRRSVTIDGHGSTVFAVTDGAGVTPPKGGERLGWPRLREQLRIRGGSNITVRDLDVVGANANGGTGPGAYVPRLEGQAGIGIQRTAGVVLDGVHVSKTYGDAVYITGAAANVTVRNSTLERTGRQGVAIVSASHVVVQGNQIRDVARSVFDLEPPGRARVEDIHLQDNTVGGYNNFLLASGGGGPGVRDVWLQGNRVAGGHGVSVYAGVAAQQRTGLHILDNSGTPAARPVGGTGRSGLLQLLNLDQVEIRGNHQPVAGGPAISLDRVCGLTVTGNEFPGASPQQQVVRACGAAAPAPTTRPRTSPSTRRAATVPATVAPATTGGDGDDTGKLLVAGGVGFVIGLGVAAGLFAAWRRGRAQGPA